MDIRKYKLVWSLLTLAYLDGRSKGAYSPPHPLFVGIPDCPGRANISNRFLCWVNALIVTLVILIGILIMHEATVGILAGIKDVLGIRPRTPRIICCPGHLKETENYVRLALHFKGERQRARLFRASKGCYVRQVIVS